MRIAFVLPGLHCVARGAETAFEALARALVRETACEVTLFGSGHARPAEPYRFVHVPCFARERFERFPSLPMFRGDVGYEEFSFAVALLRSYNPAAYDMSVTCSYPFVNWVLRARTSARQRPAHLFVTQNGDWPCQTDNREFRYFSCDGLVCTSPEYFDRNRARWFSTLIPNGVDPEQFRPGPHDRTRFGIPLDRKVALMVSGLIPAKRVLDGIRCAAQIPNLHLVVAGDGWQRRDIDACAAQLMPGRFQRLTVPHTDMPALYRSADLLLHMSLDEPFGSTQVEAFACGLQVVAHDRQLTRWLFDADAVLVDVLRDEAVIRGMTQALGSRVAASAAQAFARRFAWSAIAHDYYKFVAEVVERRHSRATTAPTNNRSV